MEYRRFDDMILIRMDPTDEVLENITKVAEAEHVQLGEVHALGASDDYDVSVYDLNEKKYYPRHCSVQSEITSLFGTISRQNGSVYLHVHMQAMDKNGKAVGGHLKRCVINATCEMFIHVIDGHAGRKMDEKTGLTILDF